MRDAPKVKTNRRRKPELTEAAILAWADAHRRRTGEWPTKEGGPVADGPLGTSWRQADNPLRFGLRGLPGGSSLARLLAAERGVRNAANLPPLAEALILGWADADRSQAAEWPSEISCRVPAAFSRLADWSEAQGARKGTGRAEEQSYPWPTTGDLGPTDWYWPLDRTPLPTRLNRLKYEIVKDGKGGEQFECRCRRFVLPPHGQGNPPGWRRRSIPRQGEAPRLWADAYRTPTGDELPA
jgi:hypothetical protein